MSATRKVSPNGKDAPFLIEYRDQKAVYLNGFIIYALAKGDVGYDTLSILALNLSAALKKKVVSIYVEGDKDLTWPQLYMILSKEEEGQAGLTSRREYL